MVFRLRASRKSPRQQVAAVSLSGELVASGRVAPALHLAWTPLQSWVQPPWVEAAPELGLGQLLLGTRGRVVQSPEPGRATAAHHCCCCCCLGRNFRSGLCPPGSGWRLKLRRWVVLRLDPRQESHESAWDRWWHREYSGRPGACIRRRQDQSSRVWSEPGQERRPAG